MSKRLGSYLVVAVAAACATVAIQAGSGGATSGATYRNVHVNVGTAVYFDGTGWSCYYDEHPDGAGVKVPSPGLRPSIFCRYLIDDGGCPFVEMANPYLWLADAGPHLALRPTGTGAFYIKTHYGCN